MKSSLMSSSPLASLYTLLPLKRSDGGIGPTHAISAGFRERNGDNLNFLLDLTNKHKGTTICVPHPIPIQITHRSSRFRGPKISFLKGPLASYESSLKLRVLFTPTSNFDPLRKISFPFFMVAQVLEHFLS